MLIQEVRVGKQDNAEYDCQTDEGKGFFRESFLALDKQDCQQGER